MTMYVSLRSTRRRHRLTATDYLLLARVSRNVEARPFLKPAAHPGSCRYLEREVLIHYTYSNIVLLRPTMAFLLQQTPDLRIIQV